MGACNFSTQTKSLTVGIVPVDEGEEQIEEYQYFEALADRFVKNVNEFINYENPISYLTDEIFNVKMEYGYYEGFQLYVEDLDGEMGENALDYYREELAQEGVDVAQIKTQLSKLWDTVQFLLIDFTKRADLGITAGGYRGGVQFDKVDQVWNEYKSDSDPEMLKGYEADLF
jgi:hypothetical protein